MKNEIKRIYHPWDEWECFKSGFYSQSPPNGMTPEACEVSYRDFLSDLNQFANGMNLVFKQWPKSCEHFLTNSSMNRIAWLGQSAMCISTGIPSYFKGGFKLLTIEQQNAADNLAEEYLNLWLKERIKHD